MPRKNYEKWRPSDKKRLLNLASFFPLTGEKYTAVELLPGIIDIEKYLYKYTNISAHKIFFVLLYASFIFVYF